MAELPKAYRPADHEGAISARWEQSGAFHADPGRVLSGEAKPYCVLIPPPNVTGALHLGHALNNTLQDILVRAHRMMGFETLWMVGTDHAGIATQAVVERRLRQEGKLKGPLKEAMTRDQFVSQVQTWKDEYEARITGQLKAMGCSCDFSRQRFTMDEMCARAVREAFFRLFSDGLIYRGKRLVNWDPVLQTAVSDDECYEEEIDGQFYYLRYPLVHRHGAEAARERQSGEFPPPPPEDAVPVTWSELARRGYPGAEKHPGEEQAWLTVATTRPETYLGDTAVAVNPHDPRGAALRHLHLELPLVGRVIPVVEDDYVVLPKALARTEEERADAKAEYATGFLKVTPAHDQNDNELYQRHKGEIDGNSARTGLINIFAPDAKVSDKHGWADVGDAHLFVGLSREEARKKVVAEFKARGLLEESKPYRHSVKHSDRSKAVIEPYLSDQWYVKVTDDRLAGAANRALVPDQRSSGLGSGGTGVPPAPGGRLAAIVQQGASTYCVTLCVASGELAPREQGIALNAIRSRHGQDMELHGAVVTPSHAYLLLTPFNGSNGKQYSLSDVVLNIQARSTELFAQTRAFGTPVWQQDIDGRTVRDRDDFAKAMAFLQELPVRKYLVSPGLDYPYMWLSDNARRGEVELLSRVAPNRTAAFAQAQDLEVSDAGDGFIRFYPARYAKMYESWHDNIRDWCISRQLWWGHRIPVWTKTCNGEVSTGAFHDLDQFFGLIDPMAAHNTAASIRFSDPETGEPLFPTTSEFNHGFTKPVRIDVCIRQDRLDEKAKNGIEHVMDRAGWKQDPDVLDTWFSSALWPMSTMGWPESSRRREFAWSELKTSGPTKDLLKAFNPTSLLSTAREIITLWVSRMVMMNRYFMGEGGGRGPAPFRDVFIHAVVQDGDGKRMSKSAGNGVDPLDIIASHGTDAMRYTLAQMSTNTQDVRLPVAKDPATGRNTSPKFDAGRNFCNKLWNAARFAVSILEKAGPGGGKPVRAADLPLIDRWMLSRLAGSVKRAEGCLANYEFADYAENLYRLLWWDFCDWYLEGIKPTVDQSAGSGGQRAVLANALSTILRLLHPVAPFVTEAIWERLKEIKASPIAGVTLESGNSGLLCTAGWPKIDGSLVDANAEEQFEALRELVSAVRNLRSEHQVQPKRKIVLHAGPKARATIGLAPDLAAALAGLEGVVATVPGTGAASVAFRCGGEDLHISNLADAVDAGTEKERLLKQIGSLRKSEAALNARLANPGYADKAPAKLVEESRSQLAKIREEIAVLERSVR